jgi:1-aminocyclopropane-1-carboxylate deaminase/D-cysteine desulfhydrase-like pyridoxal-dependent ACC family enzyme
MSFSSLQRKRFSRIPRSRLASLPTPLEEGPELPGGNRLLVKRDDLTGLGMGGNKARKLEFLCGAAVAAGADTLVTVGAAQSNHARMTAAAAAVLGMKAELVIGGPEPAKPSGNQSLSRLFGANLHFPGTDDWNVLSEALDELVANLEAEGARPFSFPMGGSTPVGALGFVNAWIELMDQCDENGLAPDVIVHASSTGGTHAGLLAGRSIWLEEGRRVPRIVAVDVAKESEDLRGDAIRLAEGALELLGRSDVSIPDYSAELDDRWLGEEYAVPTEAGDAAVRWGGSTGGLVIDRTYTGKALAAARAIETDSLTGPAESVLFWHTGGHPAVFAEDGLPITENELSKEEV